MLQRVGPQVPVRFRVGQHDVQRHPVSSLNPGATPFLPAVVRGGLEVDDILLSDVVDGVLGSEEVMVGGQPHCGVSPPPCGCHGLPAGSCPQFISQFVRLVEESVGHPSGRCNMDGARIPLPYRQIDPGPWDVALQGYFDRHHLVEALSFGWDLSFTHPPSPRDATANLPSAYANMHAVDQYISTELQFASLVGPLPPTLPFAVFRSPLGVVPKPPDGWRTITDCSQRGAGINQWIPADMHRGLPSKITLPGSSNICHAVRAVRLRYPGEVVELFKGDYSRYYRQFAVCPTQSPFLAVGWRGETYADLAWSFGNRGACGGAQRFSSAVAWFFRTKVPPAPGLVNSGIDCRCDSHCLCGDNFMVVYVDDSIAVVPRCNAEFLFHEFCDLVARLGLLLSSTPGHITRPSPVVVALGLQFDTLTNTVSLPAAKLVAVRELLLVWLHKVAASPRDLASLAGKLLWCCNAVPPGRIFLGRVLHTKRHADRLGRSVSLDTEFRRDIRWWQLHIAAWNGRSFLLPRFSADVAIDASSTGWTDGGPGLGGFCFANNEFFATGVPAQCADWPIGDLELLAHVVALSVWGDGWAGHVVSILTDNEGCRWLLENGRTRDPRRLHMARLLVGMQFSLDFRVESARITTDQNTLADSLSRLGHGGMWGRFMEECSVNGVLPCRVSVPPETFASVLSGQEGASPSVGGDPVVTGSPGGHR